MLETILAWIFSRSRYLSVADMKSVSQPFDCRLHDATIKVYPMDAIDGGEVLASDDDYESALQAFMNNTGGLISSS
jgi:hypothetical protein